MLVSLTSDLIGHLEMYLPDLVSEQSQMFFKQSIAVARGRERGEPGGERLDGDAKRHRQSDPCPAGQAQHSNHAWDYLRDQC